MNDIRDHDLDQLLRAYDVAGNDTSATRAALDARLRDLPSDSPTATVIPMHQRRRRPVMRRVAGLVAAAAAGATALVLLPGTGQSNAYASWTATPQAVADRDAAIAVEECRDAQRGPFWARQKGGPQEFDPEGATVALTERRGDLVSVVLRDEGPMKSFSGFCVLELAEGATSGKSLFTGVAGATGGPPDAAPADSFFDGSMAQYGSEISMIDGAVGADVESLTLHAGDLTAQATVDNGRYAAWFPGRIFPDEPPGPSGPGGPEPIITYDLVLKDGTVIENARPAKPSDDPLEGPVPPPADATPYTGEGGGVSSSDG